MSANNPIKEEALLASWSSSYGHRGFSELNMILIYDGACNDSYDKKKHGNLFHWLKKIQYTTIMPHFYINISKFGN